MQAVGVGRQRSGPVKAGQRGGFLPQITQLSGRAVQYVLSFYALSCEGSRESEFELWVSRATTPNMLFPGVFPEFSPVEFLDFSVMCSLNI